MDMTRLSWAMWEDGEREGQGRGVKGRPGAEASRPKVQTGLVIKMSGFYKSLWGKGSIASGLENSG